MTTNNHSANGPVSLDRLHQISEILSKAAAQSEGGNLGYAMADAVKVIDEVLEARNAEPVVLDEDPRDAFERSFKMPKHVTRCGTGYAVTEYSAWLAHDFIRMWEGWKACRAAMLQASNSPVIPDGWVMVPVEPTMAMLDEFDSIIDYGAEDSKDAWSRLIAAALQQEVRSALEHGMQRYAGAMQKLSEGDK
ncbi:hypothetical protein OGX92_22125 [Citrobacter sp. Cpo089]|uniref:hypothetical protein n=1 Tax=Citrobacter sp. Cpo089 TaxID=2985138 RepID=UPI002575D157|nr:hypothetical protein [Citrobacter sp. Cpo089]MDM2828055.1 hypothetical protein [Citrobacter sp. Cpo089]